MNLPKAPDEYDATNESQARRIIETEDKKNIKIGQVLNQLLFRDTVTGQIVVMTVASGAAVFT